MDGRMIVEDVAPAALERFRSEASQQWPFPQVRHRTPAVTRQHLDSGARQQ